MTQEEKHKEDLKAAKGWLAIAKKDNNTMAIQIMENLFPELSESEDEKIIRTLKEIVNWGCAKNISVENNVELKDCLAWIEKQGEQKPTNKIEQSCYHNDGLYYAIDILEKTLGKVEGYQSDDGKMEHQIAIETVNALYHKKPAELSKEDEEMFDAIIADIKFTQKAHDHDVNQVVYEREIDWLKSLKDRMQPQPKQDWNEEDEKKRKLLIAILKVNHPNAHFKVNPKGTVSMETMSTEELVDWLKSIKDRIQPQSKQEWSVEDTKMINFIINILECAPDMRPCSEVYHESAYQKQINWLKSLKPNHWKPSEKQLSVLQTAIKDYGTCAEKNVLESLYSSLKTL